MGSHQVSTCYLGLGVGPGFQPHPAPEGLHPIAFPLFIALLTLPIATVTFLRLYKEHRFEDLEPEQTNTDSLLL